MLDIIRTFEKVNEVKVNHRIAERRAGDVAALYADASLAEKELGWTTTLGLEDMVRSAWAWEKKVRGI